MTDEGRDDCLEFTRAAVQTSAPPPVGDRRTTRLEVRCCCDPGKLLGSLPVPMPRPREGDIVRYQAGDQVVELHVDAWQWYAPFESPGGDVRDVIEVVNFGHVRIHRALAIKSMDTPIAVLRQIAGFVEARP